MAEVRVDLQLRDAAVRLLRRGVHREECFDEVLAVVQALALAPVIEDVATEEPQPDPPAAGRG